MGENHFEKMVANGDRLPALVAICSALYSFFHLRLEQMLFELGMSLRTITREELRTFILNSFVDATFVPMTEYDRPNTWYKALNKKQAKRLKLLRLVGKPVFAKHGDAEEFITPQRDDHSLDRFSQKTFASFDSGLAVGLRWELGGVAYRIVKQCYYQSPTTTLLSDVVKRFRDWILSTCVSGLPSLSDAKSWINAQDSGRWELVNFTIAILSAPALATTSAERIIDSIHQVEWVIRSVPVTCVQHVTAAVSEHLLFNAQGWCYAHENFGNLLLIPRERSLQRSDLYVSLAVTFATTIGMTENPLFKADQPNGSLEQLPDVEGKIHEIDTQIQWAMETVLQLPRSVVRLLVRGRGDRGRQYFTKQLMRRIFLEPALRTIRKTGDMRSWYLKQTKRYAANMNDEEAVLQMYEGYAVRTGEWEEEIDMPSLDRAVEGAAHVFGISPTEVSLTVAAKMVHFGLPRPVIIDDEPVRCRRHDSVQQFTLYVFALLSGRQLPPLHSNQGDNFLDRVMKMLCQERVPFHALPFATRNKEIEFVGQERILKQLVNDFAATNSLHVAPDDWDKWRDILDTRKDEHSSPALALAHTLFLASIDFIGRTLNVNAWAYQGETIYTLIDRWRAQEFRAKRIYTGERERITHKEWVEVALIFVESGSPMPAKSFLNKEARLLVDLFLPWHTRGGFKAALEARRAELGTAWKKLSESESERDKIRAGLDSGVDYKALIEGFKEIREEERKKGSKKAAKKGKKGSDDEDSESDSEDE